MDNELILRLTDLERRLANQIRLGTIAEIDPPAARVRVQSGQLLTDWIPWLTPRAGATATWSAPTIGEQVLLIAPSGDPAQALALPALYANATPAPSGDPAEHTTHYPDGAVITYNHATHHAAITGIATAEIQATATITLNAPLVIATGAFTVQGLLTYQAGLAGTGGGPGTTITGDLTQTGGQLTSNGITLATHTHGGVRTGGDSTGAPQ